MANAARQKAPWPAVASLTIGVIATACSQIPGEVVVTVDINADKHPISPHIYGVSLSGGARPYFEDIGISVSRWGGNARTRFNWEINASNVASDWEFRNVKKGDDTPGSAALAFHAANAEGGADSLLTIPMIGWVAKDGDEQTRSLDVPDELSFPIYFGSEGASGYDPAANRERTSVVSMARKGGEFAFPPDLGDGVVYQDEWVSYLKAALGPASGNGIRFYEMDNEPFLWSETHRDVRPAPLGYDEYLATFLEYATAVKDVDPTAQILGPSVWGWRAYFYSALDEGGDGYRTAADRKAHGNVPFLPWLLSEVSKRDALSGRRTLDYLAVHYFPQGGVFSDDVSEDAQARRLRSTHSLWDAGYKDESWIRDTSEGPYVRLIPRMREWIDQSYPGTKLAITEWNWGEAHHISGGLAAADALGIFGREGVDLATYFGEPSEGSPVYWAFRMLRNYDGDGGGFGDISVSAKSSDVGFVSAYASIDSATNEVKVLLINKSPDAEAPVRLDALGIAPNGEFKAYRYSEPDGGIVSTPPLLRTRDGFSIALPPYSMTMLITRTQSKR